MYAQNLLHPKHMIHSAPTNHHQRLVFSPKPKSRIFNSEKRVSESRISSRKSSHWVVTRCGGSQAKQEQKQEEEYDDGYYMKRCLELAKKGIGQTSPNPMVGCVIVKDGKIVGEGFHPKVGQPHAEVFALRDAGDLAANGTAYVTLEPCNHYGRTPPCSEAFINAKLRKVVIGMVDRNPIVASKGVKRLQEAGIEVIVGVEEELCKRFYEAYTHQMLTGKPFVSLRYSISLDGHHLSKFGEEVLEHGGYYSILLQEHDAVILSSNALAENSSFPMSKEPGSDQPLTIVLSKNLNSLVQDGIQMVSFGRESLAEILEDCKSRGFFSVLLDLMACNVDFEGIIEKGFEQNLFQKVLVEVLPIFGGDEDCVFDYMDLKVKVKKLTSRVSGKSVVLEGYF